MTARASHRVAAPGPARDHHGSEATLERHDDRFSRPTSGTLRTNCAIDIQHARSADDFQAVRELCLEYADGLGVDLETQQFSHEIASLPGSYAPPRGCLLIARVDSAAAGCVALKPLSDRACEMKRLYVRPAYRQHRIGRALIERLLVEAEAAGYDRMRLDTIPARMRSALALYEALGFADIPPYWDNPLPGVRYMERALGR